MTGTERTLPSQGFNLREPFTCGIDGDGDPIVIGENCLGFTAQITVFEADLDVAQARALRDWLNEVLP